MTKRGILLLAFGRREYGFWAYNMALSIRMHSPDIPIHLVHDDKAISQFMDWQRSLFTSFQQVEDKDILDAKGRINPGQVKTRLYNYLPYDETIYLDADGALLKPIEPLFDYCKAQGGYFYTQVTGEHKASQGRDFKEMPWAYADDVVKHYGLSEDDTLYATNSSFMYIKKGRDAKAFFAQVKKNFEGGLPLNKLRYKWGGTFPDELAFNVALTQKGIDGKLGIAPLLQSNKRIERWSEISPQHYILSLYGIKGTSTHKSLMDYYDALLRKWNKEKFGGGHIYKAHILMNTKHANRR